MPLLLCVFLYPYAPGNNNRDARGVLLLTPLLILYLEMKVVNGGLVL